MLTKDDLFTSVSPTAVNTKQEAAKQDSTPSPPKEKRKYATITKPKRMPSQADRFKICKLLEEHLAQKDANGLVSYLNDMSDEKIAKLVGPNTSIDSVRHMRQEVFGIIRKVTVRGQSVESTDMLARIVKLEELFNKLAEEIGSAFRV
jgi:hypothetical protein